MLIICTLKRIGIFKCTAVVDTPLHKGDVCQLMIDWNQFSGSCKVENVTDGQLVTNFNFASRQLFNFQKQPLEKRFSKQKMSLKNTLKLNWKLIQVPQLDKISLSIAEINKTNSSSRPKHLLCCHIESFSSSHSSVNYLKVVPWAKVLFVVT